MRRTKRRDGGLAGSLAVGRSGRASHCRRARSGERCPRQRPAPRTRTRNRRSVARVPVDCAPCLQCQRRPCTWSPHRSWTSRSPRTPPPSPHRCRCQTLRGVWDGADYWGTLNASPTFLATTSSGALTVGALLHLGQSPHARCVVPSCCVPCLRGGLSLPKWRRGAGAVFSCLQRRQAELHNTNTTAHLDHPRPPPSAPRLGGHTFENGPHTAHSQPWPNYYSAHGTRTARPTPATRPYARTRVKYVSRAGLMVAVYTVRSLRMGAVDSMPSRAPAFTAPGPMAPIILLAASRRSSCGAAQWSSLVYARTRGAGMGISMCVGVSVCARERERGLVLVVEGGGEGLLHAPTHAGTHAGRARGACAWGVRVGRSRGACASGVRAGRARGARVRVWIGRLPLFAERHGPASLPHTRTGAAAGTLARSRAPFSAPPPPQGHSCTQS
jgi:hypothetical protein